MSLQTEPHSDLTPDAHHQALMDGVYKYQRYIYDVTRKFYLLGRDRLIADLALPPRAHVLEVGCGTGRNMLHASRGYEDAQFYGIDISTEMLETAQQNAVKKGRDSCCHFALGDAGALDTVSAFDRAEFDAVFMSYTLSMIPPWREAIEQAYGVLKPGGSLHIVDFGMQEELPVWFRSLLTAWLKLFHVSARAELPSALETFAVQSGARLRFHSLYKGYCWTATLTKDTDSSE